MPNPAAALSPVAALWRFYLRLRFQFFQRKRLGKVVLEEVSGKPFLVLPQVFNPRIFRTGAFLAESLSPELIPKNASLLDLGTGSGIGAVFAAPWASRILAVDINPEAVRCARINALLNAVEDKVEVRQGDLFDGLAAHRFDVVLFNPPYYRGEPTSQADRAFRATDVAERFAAQLEDHLQTKGCALLDLSTDAEEQAFLAPLKARRYTIDVVATRNLINETLRLYRCRLTSGP